VLPGEGFPVAKIFRIIRPLRGKNGV